MKKLITICLAVTMILAISGQPVMAGLNLLVDPGFEVNPLDTTYNVLNYFATYEGIWGVEAATRTGVDGGVTPFEGVKMLRMTDDGLNATQAYQVTNVSGYVNLIDNVGAKANLSAMFSFNFDTNAPPHSALSLDFFSGNSWDTMIGSYLVNRTLENLPGTWDFASISCDIPVGTRWIASQVLYSNASLQGHPGYVDAVELTIVPEPATIALLGLGCLLLRRKRSKA